VVAIAQRAKTWRTRIAIATVAFGLASPMTGDSRARGMTILAAVDTSDRLRLADRRVTDPLESLAQRLAERVVGLPADALGGNDLMRRAGPDARAGQGRAES
jgi:hypothetical protein